MYILNLYCFCVVLQSFGADCTLEEEGLGEEEDEIDQFNDDTFGAGANGTVFFSAILKPGPLHLNLPNKAYCITFVTLDHKTSHKVFIYLLRFIHNLVFIFIIN